MLAKTSTIAGVVIGAALFATNAYAQNDPESEAKPAVAATGGGEGNQLTLPKGRAVLDAFVEISLNDGAVFKPVSLSPDVWYGVTDDITAGLVHSSVGMSGFLGGSYNSLCLLGASNGCSSIYPNFGLVGRYKLKNGPLSYAAEGGLLVNNTDPFAVGIRAGAVGRYEMGKLAIEAEPSVLVGVTERDANRDVLALPATVLFSIAPQITLAGQSGLILPFQNTGDAYAVPLSVGGMFRVNESLTVTAALSFPRLIANGGGIDARSTTLGGIYAF